MNLTDSKYSGFALVQEMLETPELIANFDFSVTKEISAAVRHTGRLFLTGEGSSRIFPSKNLIGHILHGGHPICVATEGSIQAMEYDLSDWVVVGATNSGQTKEIVMLFDKLKEEAHANRYAVTANAGKRIEEVASQTLILRCGREKAVAATKSVVEQALTYQSILCGMIECQAPALREKAAALAKEVLAVELDPGLIAKLAAAPMVYYAGRNNGVAEELTLKTNEIMRKKSDFLEGTYLLHGIEEIMQPEEVIVLVDPFPSEYAMIKKNLVDTIGMTVIAISEKDTVFPTIRIPSLYGYNTYLQLLAGWNLLVQTGLALGVDLDKPQRARKVGNSF